ncbi:MAG TPA: hypothetical protein VN285_09660 [Candidatus Deferrimicrobium sp.]|nr:hypothetical protein [Candidatus Deferrimicrobium sp.]
MPSSKLYVGNLNYTVTTGQLEDLFSTYGQVKHVNIIEGRGFGFVEMSTAEEAEKAKKELNGAAFEGRKLKIDDARPPRERDREQPDREKRDRRRF